MTASFVWAARAGVVLHLVWCGLKSQGLLWKTFEYLETGLFARTGVGSWTRELSWVVCELVGVKFQLFAFVQFTKLSVPVPTASHGRKTSICVKRNWPLAARIEAISSSLGRRSKGGPQGGTFPRLGLDTGSGTGFYQSLLSIPCRAFGQFRFVNFWLC